MDSFTKDGDVLVQMIGNSDRMELSNSSNVEKTPDSKDLLTSSGRYHRHHHHHHHRVHKEKKKPCTKSERFNKTAAVLQKAGLMEMALQTAQIMEENAQLQRDIDALKEEAKQFAQTLQEKLQHTPQG